MYSRSDYMSWSKTHNTFRYDYLLIRATRCRLPSPAQKTSRTRKHPQQSHLRQQKVLIWLAQQRLSRCPKKTKSRPSRSTFFRPICQSSIKPPSATLASQMTPSINKPPTPPPRPQPNLQTCRAWQHPGPRSHQSPKSLSPEQVRTDPRGLMRRWLVHRRMKAVKPPS